MTTFVDWLFRLLIPDWLFDLLLRAVTAVAAAAYAWYTTDP